MDEGILNIVATVVMSLKTTRDTTSTTCNIELLVDLVVGNLVHQVLKGGIKISKVLSAVGLDRQLGLGKGGVYNNIQEWQMHVLGL